MLEWVWPIAFPPELIDRMTGFANSNFATSLIGSLTGAFAGAAQRIVERSKDRELLAKEIRQLNAATTLLSSVANTHITLKKQHVKRLRDEYEEEHRNVLGFLEARKAGRAPPQQTIDFKADMQTPNCRCQPESCSSLRCSSRPFGRSMNPLRCETHSSTSGSGLRLTQTRSRRCTSDFSMDRCRT